MVSPAAGCPHNVRSVGVDKVKPIIPPNQFEAVLQLVGHKFRVRTDHLLAPGAIERMPCHAIWLDHNTHRNDLVRLRQ
jgi:hypothetical protein